MLSSIIFHFVFALFAIWAGIAWLLESRRLKSLRYTLIPLLALKSIEFPRHRSLVVRGMKSLGFELSGALHVKTEIFLQIEKNIQILHNPFYSLCQLFDCHIRNSEKCMKLNERLLTATEFLQEIKHLTESHLKINKIIFRYSITELIWYVEVFSHV